MATQSIPREAIICPACGAANAPDAIFCGQLDCEKALGEFRYVGEELCDTLRWHEIIADKISRFIGKPQFFVVHGLWFLVWIAVNTGVIAVMRRFDEYPFDLLNFFLAMEAIFMTGFLLISSNRQSAHTEKRAELDYEVNVRTYRLLKKNESVLLDVIKRLEHLEAALESLSTRKSQPL